MFVVDTNLLIYAVNPDAPEHETCLAALEEWRSGARSWFLTWGIVYEFLRVTTHTSVFPSPIDLSTAWQWLTLLLRSPRSGIIAHTDRHHEVLAELVERYPRLRGNVTHDMHTVALMREHGIVEIRTADADFHQFEFLEVVNPLVQRR